MLVVQQGEVSERLVEELDVITGESAGLEDGALGRAERGRKGRQGAAGSAFAPLSGPAPEQEHAESAGQA